MMVEIFSSFSCSFCSSVSPSIRGILMSTTNMSTSWFAFSTAKASTPSQANRKLTAPSRIWCRNFCWISASRSGSSSTTKIRAVMRRVQLAYRFRCGASRSRLVWLEAPRRRAPELCALSLIAIGGNHNDRNIRPQGLCFGQEFKATHPRHIDVGEDQNERTVACIGNALKRHAGGLRKLHREAVGAKVVPKLLPEQNLHIGLIINHENEQVHFRSPDLAMVAAPRGRTTLNSVKSPGCVSTSIEPACCLTMMS